MAHIRAYAKPTEAEVRQIVERAGAIFDGFHYDEANKPFAISFTDPQTRSTFGLKIADVTEENVREKLKGEAAMQHIRSKETDRVQEAIRELQESPDGRTLLQTLRKIERQLNGVAKDAWKKGYTVLVNTHDGAIEYYDPKYPPLTSSLIFLKGKRHS